MTTPENAKQIIEKIFQDHPAKNFAVRLWDGSEIKWNDTRDFTLIFHDADTFASLLYSQNPAVLAEGYIEKKFDIEGDIYQAIGIASYLRTIKLNLAEKMRLAIKLGIPKTRHSREDDARDVQAHYDLSNDFYKLFLDKRMVYSCAYFARPDQSLEEAQERKLDVICQKLRLQTGEHLLDIGCGWGALVIWAAKNYGVKAHGITLSKNQFELAQQHVKEAGLENKITLELRHYLDLPKNTYDKVASIGMYEHVGIAKYPEYFGAVREALKPGGLFLNHGITRNYHIPENIGGDFVSRHIFPGGELDTISHSTVAGEEAGFEVIDVEALRRQYALTLREWMRRFTERETEAAKFIPEKKIRAWRLYLAGFALAFEQGNMGICQSLLAKPKEDGSINAPLTREDIKLKI